MWERACCVSVKLANAQLQSASAFELHVCKAEQRMRYSTKLLEELRWTVVNQQMKFSAGALSLVDRYRRDPLGC